MNDDRRPERDAAADGLLARYKRASLSRQAQRAAWHLGALVRRVEREAPEVYPRLRDTVEVLLQLGAKLSHPRPPAGSPRQGELF